MAERAKVVVADFIIESLDHERRVLGDVAEPVALNARHEDDLVGRVEDADALMLYHTIALTERTIARLRRCRLIVRCGVGYDNVDVAAARRYGIPVANVPDYGTEEVADSAIGLALALTRGIHLLTGRLRERRGEWTWTPVRPRYRLRGRVFGVVGLGRIGTAAALRARALGMDVLFHDPYVPDGRDRALGVRRAETLAELLGQAYVVSLHCPLTAETRHLMNVDTLARMAPGSYLVNTSRGAVVDALAVLDAVTRGHLAGAALDVLEHEPPPEDHPLVVAWRDPRHPAHDRIILNPHTAFYSEEGLLDMRLKGSENCRRVLLGQPPRNVVN
jgi:D-3-phosphoglycerate dehydrogenase/C-terminal binding protein